MAEALTQVLILDDEADVRDSLSQWLEVAGLTPEPLAEAEAVLQRLTPNFPGVLISDVKMPGMDGVQLLDAVLTRDADLPVILMSGHGDIPMAVAAMRRGAYDFIEKPFAPDRLLEAVKRALEKRALVLENRALRHYRAASGMEALLVGRTPVMDRLRTLIADLASTSASVLILGETGAGKELVARCLHDFSPRAKKPFVALNCGAIPESMAESELFGHEAGAFTGATSRHIGKLEYATGGTLFLDEIESMSAALQVKLLRALQERVIERLGSHKPIAIDLRVVAATKERLTATARFRADLYYRLAVAEIELPPLRARQEDILLLFQRFADSAARSYRRPLPPVSSEMATQLQQHPWPGNVRELRNSAERYALGLPPLPGPGLASVPPGGAPLNVQIDALERRLLIDALHRHQGAIAAVMADLGLPRRTLNEKMLRYGLERQDFVTP
jgi:two-component system, NtrC family, C4-dicarboxylate transport response regulator DctD